MLRDPLFSWVASSGCVQYEIEPQVGASKHGTAIAPGRWPVDTVLSSGGVERDLCRIPLAGYSRPKGTGTADPLAGAIERARSTRFDLPALTSFRSKSTFQEAVQ